ncbi:MAG: dTMP kinase [Planctomycetota bacterium]
MARGIFLAIEGPDGGGKTTQAGLLAEHLRKAGREVVPVREPGGTPLGERVRALLLEEDFSGMDVRTELFLFMAARAELVRQVIRPALARGAAVLSDRFLLSTLVYQGLAGGLPLEEVRVAGRTATGGLAPDLTLVLDVPAEVGLARLKRAPDRMEEKGLAFHRAIRQGYLDLAPNDPGIVVIDATQPAEAVAGAVWEAVSHALR